MSKTLTTIAKELMASNSKKELIYAFNGTGKTRLSREFKSLISNSDDEESLTDKKIFYYSAFTEDLFYWDNDLENDIEPKLKIHNNIFTEWIFNKQGKDQKVIEIFQGYTDEKLTPKFNSGFNEVTFSYTRGNDEIEDNIKISKGEESNFIWSIFYVFLLEVIETLNVAYESEEDPEEFGKLEYVFIDDPVTSLDDNHLIALAVDLSKVIKISKTNLKFIITTHNPIFYNVVFNELGLNKGNILSKYEDGTYILEKKEGDSNKNFIYHHYLINLLDNAINENKVERYHFTLLRNLYEKSANFLGYEKWSDLLPEDKRVYAKRVMNFYSHQTLTNETIADPTEPEKQMVKYLYNHLINEAKFWKEN